MHAYLRKRVLTKLNTIVGLIEVTYVQIQVEAASYIAVPESTAKSGIRYKQREIDKFR